ncbi:tetratricopeptide repeat protein, partial [Enterococcus faecium]
PYRAGLGAGVAPSPRLGVARLYIQLAESLTDARVAPAAIVLARAAEQLDPGNDRARLALARALTNTRAPQMALAVLDHIAPTSPAAAEA